MDGYVKIGLLADFTEGSMKSVVTGGKKLTVFLLDGTVIAVDDACTHGACSLSGEGFLEDGAIVCGCHGGSFDGKSGKAKSYPVTEDLQVYETKVKDGTVYLKLK